MSKIIITYGDTEIAKISEQISPISISYNGNQIATINDDETKTLECSGKFMRGDVNCAGKTLNCNRKKMTKNIVIKCEEEVIINQFTMDENATDIYYIGR